MSAGGQQAPLAAGIDHLRRLMMLRRERFPTDERILDIGCGDYKRGTIGLDISPGPSVDVVADALNMPFSDDSFDAIICYHLVEHLDAKGFSLLVAQSRRVLKPAGRLYLLVDRDESIEKLLSKDPTHIERYSPEYIRERVAFGFHIDVFQTHNLLGNVHNHPLRWPLLLGKGTKVYIEGTPRP